MLKLLLLLLICGFLGACTFTSGSGDIISKTRNTGSFSGLHVAGGFEVEVRTGAVHKVVVEADDNLMDDVETRVVGGKLTVKMKDRLNVRDAHLKVLITAPTLTDLQSSASADIKVIGVLSADKTIQVKASSGSSIKAEVDAPGVEADASSGAEVVISGRTRTFDAQSSSGSSIEAEALLSENTTAASSSGASAEVHASVQLNAKASSGGIVNYRGAAAVVKKESSGGSIAKVN